MLAQLSTYLKAGIPLVESIKILIKQFRNKNYERILRGVIYDLTTGESFSEALAKQGNAFPRLLINMVKASEMTGELPEALDEMEEYFTESEEGKRYPGTTSTEGHNQDEPKQTHTKKYHNERPYRCR